MPNPQTLYTVLGLGKEANWGTSAARSLFLPIEQPRMQPQGLRHVLDQGLRGQPALEYDLIPGPGEGSLQWQGNVYVDVVPLLILALLGTESVSGSGTYTHTIRASATPPSLSVEWAQNVQPYLFAGMRPSQLQFNFSARDGAFTYQLQGQSKLATTVSATTPAWGTATAIAGWQGSVTIGGGAPASLLEGQITLQRQLRPVHGLASTQDLAALHPGPIQVTGRLTFEFSRTNEYAYYASATPTKNAVALSFVQTAGSAELSFTMSKAGWRLVDIEVAENIYTVVAQINGLHNTTDQGPVAVVAKNGQPGY